MDKSQKFNGFLGIDVSEETFDASCINAEGERLFSLSTSIQRPWVYVDQVPGPLYHLPPNYRNMSGYSYRHIPHNDVNKNWRAWERGKY